jgi:tetraacyldisaccharide 4'-kinase|tara:strand:+ start:16198 stop:17226 length:1029 start_codon:yes stop_codon:yes gene_type:complete
MFRKKIERQLDRAWYGDAKWSRALLPFEALYARGALKAKIRGQISADNNVLSIPLIVVGNISVGGTGKSPVVIRLAKELKNRGYRPGILSRGYGAQTEVHPRLVSADDEAAKVGDEPLMMAASLPDIPIVIDRDRLRGAQYLKNQSQVDLVICDDGLQHYALPRDIEIVVLDAERGIGNGHLIPVGPLRESVDRLGSVDYILCNGALSSLPSNLSALVNYQFAMQPKSWQSVKTGESKALDQVDLGDSVLAVSAIGNPGRFHNTLRTLGLQPKALVFPDHHAFKAEELVFAVRDYGLPLVMTAKDAVKCRSFAYSDWLALQVEAELPEDFIDSLLEKLRELN